MVLQPLEKQLVTIDEFEAFIALPENQDRLFELIDGEIVEKMPTVKHGIIASLIATFLNLYFFEHPIGWVTVEAHYRLPDSDKHDRIPDVSVILEGHVIPPYGPALFIPELCIEIQSPDDSLKKMADSAAFYLANGAKMVWLVYPSRQLIEALTATDRQFFGIEDTLTAGDLLPGFSVEVRRLFPSV